MTSEYALKIQNLSKSYATGVVALQDVSFTVKPGDFFALLGPNGAGKSTLIGIITSIVNKSGGSIEIFGQDIDKNFSKAKQLIGVVPQEFNCSIFERAIDVLTTQAGYFGVPKPQALENAEFYLNELNLWDKRHTQVRQLSGGMKRRLMIARGLIHHPKLLILDEPTAGVDIEIRRSMWRFIRQINANGTTVILTTHYLEEAESLCNHIAIIDEGRIKENTTMRKLLSRLHVETLVLYLCEPITQAPQLPGFNIDMVDSSTLGVEISGGQTLNDLFAGLATQHIRVRSMRNKTNRLEELFLRLTQRDNHAA
jgi:ABC-2 type transport system ATP-binding protein